MRPDDLFVIPESVRIFPADQLPVRLRREIDESGYAFAATKIRSRKTTKLLDTDTKELLELFRQPRTLVDAIVAFSRSRGLIASEVLREAYPVMVELIADAFLTPDDSGSGEQSVDQTLLKAGDSLDGFRILRSVHSLEDVAVYEAESESGQRVALKVAAPSKRARVLPAFRREAAILERLDGHIAPKLHSTNFDAENLFIATSWVDGIWCTSAAEPQRRLWSESHERRLVEMMLAIAQAYDRLHESSVVHGDVHPKNVLVSGSDGVTLIDFGHAVDLTQPEAAPQRMAVINFYDPQWAQRVLERKGPSAATPLSDQYALGALLYMLYTGNTYYVGNRDLPATLRQIVEDPPLQFEYYGLDSRPELEGILATALAKDPGDRFSSIGAMADALSSVTKRSFSSARNSERYATSRFLESTVKRLSRDGGPIDEGLRTAPLSSVNFGAAGLAYFFYRLALVRGEPDYLLVATRWLDRASREIGNLGAFYNADIDLVAARVGVISPYHSASGIDLVRALVAGASGNLETAREAVSAYVLHASGPTHNFDLTLGRSSTLLGAALLAEAFANTSVPNQSGLHRFGTDAMHTIWDGLAGQSLDNSDVRFWGVAHGWAGILLASLRWCSVVGATPPISAQRVLEQLASRGTRSPRGTRWIGPLDPQLPAAWCHGSTGYVHLWLTAASVMNDERYTANAYEAAEHSWNHATAHPTLCCGLAGQSYAMVRMFQRSNDESWLRRSKTLATRAVEAVGDKSSTPNSLYKGDLGVAALIADMEIPHLAAMPVFGSERWGTTAPGFS
jgi:serine/threonine-protein kinase